MRDFGTLSGTQRKDGLFSMPAWTLGPMKGTVASNLACPHGVKGGRDCSSIPPMMATPSTFLSGNCIQTPLRSWDSAGVAGALVILGGSLVCAGMAGAKASITPRTASEPESRVRRTFQLLVRMSPQVRWRVCFSREAGRRFMGRFLSVLFLPAISVRSRFRRRVF